MKHIVILFVAISMTHFNLKAQRNIPQTQQQIQRADTKFIEPPNRVEISGLGSVANSQNGEGLSPSANILTKLLPIPKNPNYKFYLGFNLGVDLDSTKIDSLKLGNLFLPDRGKAGYSFRAEYNILGELKKGFYKNANYIFNTELNPFIEYNYNKINIEAAKEDSSRIQTSTWLIGLNFVHTLIRNDNEISFQASAFHKRVIITDGTLTTYRKIFDPIILNSSSPQRVNFLGMILGLQINRFQFSFVLEDLKSKKLENTPIYGGVYTVRATIIGDFLKL